VADPTYFTHTRPEMAALVPGEARRLLEIGCSSGGFAASIARPGRVMWGIELDPTAAEQARSRQVFDRLFNCGFDAALPQLESSSFDCIIANDVIEHLTDPWVAARSIHSLLAPGGQLVMSIPNIRYWEVVRDLWIEGQWEYEDSGIMDRTHLRFFTISSIRRILMSTGFRIDRLFGISRGPEPPWKLKLISKVVCRDYEELLFRQIAVVASTSNQN